MTQREINRLGWETFGVLLLAITNNVFERFGRWIGDGPENADNWLSISLGLLTWVWLVLNIVAFVFAVSNLFFFVRHLFRTNVRVSPPGRLGWLIFLLLGNLIAMPVYWCIYVRGTARAEAGENPIGLGPGAESEPHRGPEP
jgi:hypothetical protein